MRYILSDKKRTGNNIKLVMPVEIGKCHIRSTPIIQLQSILEAGLALWT
jgi:3-dehydroquinate synthetase